MCNNWSPYVKSMVRNLSLGFQMHSCFRFIRHEIWFHGLSLPGSKICLNFRASHLKLVPLGWLVWFVSHYNCFNQFEDQKSITEWNTAPLAAYSNTNLLFLKYVASWIKSFPLKHQVYMHFLFTMFNYVLM